MSIQTNLKKGFTLIELMVVVVIIGILAAIAIPKLFGMSAKAKASEVGPAAGTWSKLVAAYILETGNPKEEEKQDINFKNIGYTPPGYDSKATTPDPETGTTGNFEYKSTGSGKDEGVWVAKNTQKLNDCDAPNGVGNGTWTAKYKRSDDRPDPNDISVTGNGCDVLTPNFKTLR